MCYFRCGCEPVGYRGPFVTYGMPPGFYRWNPGFRSYQCKRWLEKEEYAQELKEELARVEEEIKKEKESENK